MKTISYSVQPDKVVVEINNQTQCSFSSEEIGVVGVIQEILYSLYIKPDVCMLEILSSSPDCSWSWKQRVLVYINSMYSFMWTMETPSDLYNDWELLEKVFTKLGWNVARCNFI